MGMTRFLGGLAVLACIGESAFAAGPEANGFQLTEVRKIWERAPHNAFTDLVRHQDEWFCVFREGSSHVPGSNGTIRVLHSADGAKWEGAALLSETGIDLRDPKISVTPEGRLMLLMGGSVYDGDERPQQRRLLTARTRVAFSQEGRAWSAPQPVSASEHEWLWRVTWHEGTGYGFSYTHGVPASKVTLTLWRTTNGVAYDRVATPKPPTNCWPDETTVRVLSDKTMLALVRNERKAGPVFVGRSAPPYTEWTWSDAGHAAQGPNFLVLPDGRMFYAGRDFPDGAKTVVGSMTAERCTPLLVLPSGGDTSYPGLAWHEGLLWVSYYASHEGKAAIYLAKIRVGPVW
jgi:hypothetical protein